MFHLKTGPTLADSPLAEDDNLFAATQSIHYHGPFFESDPHSSNLGQSGRFVHERGGLEAGGRKTLLAGIDRAREFFAWKCDQQKERWENAAGRIPPRERNLWQTADCRGDITQSTRHERRAKRERGRPQSGSWSIEEILTIA